MAKKELDKPSLPNYPVDEFLTAEDAKDEAELREHCERLRRRIVEKWDTRRLAPSIVNRLWEMMRFLGGTVPPKPQNIRAINAADVLLEDDQGRTDLDGAIEAVNRAIDTAVAWCNEREDSEARRQNNLFLTHVAMLNNYRKNPDMLREKLDARSSLWAGIRENACALFNHPSFTWQTLERLQDWLGTHCKTDHEYEWLEIEDVARRLSKPVDSVAPSQDMPAQTASEVNAIATLAKHGMAVYTLPKEVSILDLFSRPVSVYRPMVEWQPWTAATPSRFPIPSA